MRNWLLIFLLFPIYNFGQDQEIKDLTKFLCSSNCFGRGYVLKGDSISAERLRQEYLTRGLVPINNSYFQPFSLNVNTFPDSCSVSINDKPLAPGIDFIVHPSSGDANGFFSIRKIPKEILLEGLSTNPNLIKDFHKNEIGVIDLREYNSKELSIVKTRIELMANLIPIIEVTEEKFIWSVGREALPNAYIKIQGKVFDTLKSDLIRIDINSQYVMHYTSQNVLGLLPSKRKKAKTIMITAHYDHLGMMGENCMFPGANDNASGVAMLISLVDELNKTKNRKFNYLFVCFGGEEAGLVGSRFMSNHLPINKGKIRFLLNLDIFGSGEEGITVVNATLFEKEFKKLERLNKRKKSVERIKKRGPAANSDHYFFTEMGIPSFFIYTEGPNKNYHDIYDTFENLSFEKFDDLTILLSKFLNKL